MSYRVDYSDGSSEPAETYEKAMWDVFSRYADAEIGHDGDLMSFGDRTLCWAREADSVDDDGARACASITRVGAVARAATESGLTRGAQ